VKKLTEEKITPIYSGKPNDFCWAGFGSGSGTNLRECAKVAPPKLIFSDRPGAKLLSLEELANVQQIVVDGYKACGSWKKAQGNPEAEAEYKKAVELKPESSYFHACLADFYAEIGNVDEARAIFQKAAELCENKDEYIRERLAELGS